MMLVIVVVSVIAFALTNVFAKNKGQTILSLIFGLLFVISLSGVMANLTYHFGMEQNTETKSVNLVSSGDSDTLSMLLFQPLGDGSENVYLYKTDKKQTKPLQTGTNKVKNTVAKTNKEAYLETKTTRWVYKNSLYRFLFNIAENDKQYVRRSNTFYLPDSWLELSVSQAKKLGKLVEEKQATLKAETEQYVQENMQRVLMENPAMDEKTQKEKITQFTEAFQKEAIAKLVAEAKKE